jgi:hypothetical protein
MPHPVLDAARAFRAQAMARELAASTALTRSYGRVYQRLGAELRALEDVVNGLENPTPDQIRRLGALQALQRQVAAEVGRYATAADTRLVSEVRASMAAGVSDSRALVLANFDREWAAANGITLDLEQVSRLRAGWTRVPVEAVESLSGMVSPASPLRRALVDRLGAAVAQQVADTLVEGIALGRNPRTIFREGMAQGLTWSLSTVRTAQMYAYREATRANYQANRDVVSGWRWKATFDGRTCMSCLAMHGTLHTVDEVLNDHHQGRCTAIPVVPLAQQMGIPEPDLGDAQTWFLKRTEAQQKAQMGPGMWEEFNAGRVGFKDLSTTYIDPVYGMMRRPPTLRDVMQRGPVVPPVPRSGPASNASGSRVSDKFEVTDHKVLGPQLDATLASIDAVHGDGPLPKVPIKATNGSNRWGSVRYSNGKIIDVTVSTQSTMPRMTLVHEIGHVIDDAVAFRPATHPEYAAWQNAYQRSQAMARMRSLDKGYTQIELNDRMGVHHRPADKKFTSYLLQENEIWARSYAQYIATSSNDPAMLAELRKEQSLSLTEYPRQWQDEDFKPIAEAMDAIFKSLGWRQ